MDRPMRRSVSATLARLTLRAHRSAPARVELTPLPARHRARRALGWLVGCWAAIPFLFWIPPHYPWAAAAFLLGPYLAFRFWTGRFRVRAFAGICPRCGDTLALGIGRTIDLPHTLTCFNCHFEPRLEVRFDADAALPAPELEHQLADCVGTWSIRWLADAPFLYCATCGAGVPATPRTRAAAEMENANALLLERLTEEGGV